MNKLVALLGCSLVLGSLMHLSGAQDYAENCALYGGTCSRSCEKGYRMGLEERLCGNAKNSLCCNPYLAEDRCKNKGGQCTPKADCPGPGRPRVVTPDCVALGRECCISV